MMIKHFLVIGAKKPKKKKPNKTETIEEKWLAKTCCLPFRSLAFNLTFNGLLFVWRSPFVCRISLLWSFWSGVPVTAECERVRACAIFCCVSCGRWAKANAQLASNIAHWRKIIAIIIYLHMAIYLLNQQQRQRQQQKRETKIKQNTQKTFTFNLHVIFILFFFPAKVYSDCLCCMFACVMVFICAPDLSECLPLSANCFALCFFFSFVYCTEQQIECLAAGNYRFTENVWFVRGSKIQRKMRML